MATSSEQHASWPPPALDPAGPFAAPLGEVTAVMLVLGGGVLVIVLSVLALALSNAKAKRFVAGHRWIVGAGMIFPIVVLTGALIYGLSTTARLSDAPQPGELRIRVTGEMWWWRVAYLDDRGRPLFETANEIRIPAGQPVTLELTSADVIHSFWVPRLAAKLDMIPGRTNLLRLQADASGVYRGQCTEFCGAAHALMAFEVIAEEPARFDAWRAAQAQPAAMRVEHAHGRALFLYAGCAACHEVRGTDANGRLGPDLTHFAARRTIGAGILSNNRQTLRQWIERADALKPGVRMPAYDTLTSADREALARYLESLQ
jgi:cytochrome c oxidase subunit 2